MIFASFLILLTDLPTKYHRGKRTICKIEAKNENNPQQCKFTDDVINNSRDFYRKGVLLCKLHASHLIHTYIHAFKMLCN